MNWKSLWHLVCLTESKTYATCYLGFGIAFGYLFI